MAAEANLKRKLEERGKRLSLRTLKVPDYPIDFCSNDYLGLARNQEFQRQIEFLIKEKNLSHGSTGSRLLSGNYTFIEETEKQIADFHQAEAALIFNSGYDANLGLMSCIASRGDLILYDNLIHASLRDGIRLSLASSASFTHNDVNALEDKLRKCKSNCFVVIESVYSMDGDEAPLAAITDTCKRYSAHLIVDEAHATGVVGKRGEGQVQQAGLQQDCFARIHTFGKALGVHGAAVLGSDILKQYLINYARSFIYTTALSPASVAAIAIAYHYLPRMNSERAHLQKLIEHFQKAMFRFEKLISHTPIQVLVTPGNNNATNIAGDLQQKGFDIRPILYPTVPEGKERLRIVLHGFNSMDELDMLIEALRSY